MENMLKLGPKEMKGSIWDEGGGTTVVQILISHRHYQIDSIQFLYAVNGKVFRSEIRGELTGLKFDMVTFDHPREYLTSVSGQYRNGNYSGELVSIAFGTNIRKYGPFGRVLDTSLPQFVYNFTTKVSFGGFYGSVYNRSVYAIGVYVRPLVSLAEIESYIIKEEDRRR